MEASEILKRYWDGKAYPIPVVRIANAIGARVFVSADMEDSGAVELLPDGRFKITVRKGEPEFRRRFTIAHEIGHIALGHLRSGCPMFRDINFNGQRDYRERAANRFAAMLLMPAQDVRLAWGRIPFREMRKIFGVSSQTMLYRLEQLGLIDEE